MSIIKLKKLDYSAKVKFSSLPPVVEVMVGANLIVCVEPVNTRRTEPCVEIVFIDGVVWQCLGTVEEIYRLIETARSIPAPVSL